jgi:phytoene synthase
LTLAAYAAKAVPPLSDAWYVRLFAPPDRRDLVTAILACASEIEDCARQAREPAVARLKLAWWQEEIALLAQGGPRHPVTLALAEAGAPVATADELWRALIGAAERDVHPVPHPSVTAWRAHCVDAGALQQLLALAFDADAAASGRARALGAAVAAARILCSAQRAAARGHLNLPLDLLDASGVEPDDLAGAWPPPALDLLARLSAEARTQLDTTLAAASADGGRRLQPCLIMAALQHARLAAFVAHGCSREGDELRPHKRLWTAWRAARRALSAH